MNKSDYILPKPVKIEPFERKKITINTELLDIYSEGYGLRPIFIKFFIYFGVISPALNKETDKHFIWAMANLQISREFVRRLLSRFTKTERKSLCDRPGLTSIESYMYTMYENRENGKTLSLKTVCATIANRERQQYLHNGNPYSKRLYATAERIRNLYYNNKKSEKKGTESYIGYNPLDEY